MRTFDLGVRRAGLAACASLSLAMAVWGAANMDIQLVPVSLKNTADINRVQLIDGDIVQLAASTSEGELSLVNLSTGSEAVHPLPLFPGAAWDARLAPGGVAAVYTFAGSAFCAIMSKSTAQPKAIPVNPDGFAIYLNPHYVKGAAGDVPITAIRVGSSDTEVKWLLQDPKTHLTSTRTIGRPALAIPDARLQQDEKGYWLFTLAYAAAGDKAAPRSIQGAKVRPTVLFAERLDAGLVDQGHPVAVFADLPVYEFDAAPAAGGEVAIFATTPLGAIFFRGALRAAPLPPDAWKQFRFAAPLSSPSILVHNGTAYLAAIQSQGEPAERILQGRINP